MEDLEGSLQILLDFKVDDQLYSDHHPLVLTIKGQNFNEKKTKREDYNITRYRWSADGLATFKMKLEELREKNIPASDDLVYTFNQRILEAMSSAKITYSIKGGPRKSKPWFDKDCYDMKKLAKESLKKYRKTNRLEDRECYASVRKKYLALLDLKRKGFDNEKQEILRNAKDSKTFWKTIALYKSTSIIQGEISIQDWLNFYRELMTTEKNLRICNLHNVISQNDPILDSEITNADIYKEIAGLRSNKACGPDGIPNEVLKTLPDSYILLLKQLYNSVMTTGKYPAIWTNSTIHPIFKNGYKNSPSNYRDLPSVNLPEFGDIHLLLYADDIAIIGESRINLQKKIKILKEYLDENLMTLNEFKSKIMVFRNGETFDFSTPNEWPKWRKRFERYLVVSGMKKKEEADKIDLFMYLMGDRADDIFRTFKFEKEEEATKIDSVLKAFDSHFCVRKNIIYERAKFNSRIQEDREPVDEFITSLYKLADSCEFEGLHEQLIRDRIVVGVRDKALSERMQLDSELTLEKAVKMVRQQEAVRQQQVDLQRPSTSQKVNQVKFNSKKQSPKQQQQPSRKKEKSAITRSRCPKCGGFTHREGQACRAEGQRCNLCSKTGHFANCCPDKQAKTAEVKAVSELDEEIGFLLEVSAVEDSSNLDDDEGECRRRWTAEIQVNGKKVKFKLDSQADVTCVPLCLFKKIMGQQRLVKSDINLRAAEFSELQTVGMFISTLRNGNYEIKEKIYVIRRLSEPLLSRRACELLNLARRIEVVATRINPIKDEMLTKIFEAQQEDTTLKAVVNYLEQGWPDKKKMSQALLSYWHVKDELGVQNGLLMRSCRLVIPASMKLEILDKLHAGHFGITKTRLRARETVWWPGISEEIAETVRKCSVCIQEAVSKHEPLIPTNFPTRPWQKIGMDLFKFENKWYLVVIDYYSRFPEVVQLDRLTANVVSNGMAEAGVKIAKLILKKLQDPSLGLLEYRSTPLENGYSPAELLMGRKLRTTLPIAPENLNPKLVDSQTLKRKEGRRRKDMKSRYDRRCGATDMEELSEGDTVWITDMRTWGIVKKKASTPRSYMVDTPVGTLRRNRFHLRKGVTVQYPADPSTPTFSGEELVENEKTPVVDYPSNDSEDGQIRTRSGRIVKPVDRLHY
ncbi:hypothetical protein LAZ67_8002419 [Cordylochernes scorpioides]|uniref:RNA-directed DNA polymerase n=1 Tax=Cordylochernes scorpioides TaxID=51811 RepID=A0ABY6KRM0_9ARAC|nr:hypothetical protein LAZ67_8002419 [Cordylochernes scorpioides]